MADRDVLEVFDGMKVIHPTFLEKRMAAEIRALRAQLATAEDEAEKRDIKLVCDQCHRGNMPRPTSFRTWVHDIKGFGTYKCVMGEVYELRRQRNERHGGEGNEQG